jgi:hypothetical protein
MSEKYNYEAELPPIQIQNSGKKTNTCLKNTIMNPNFRQYRTPEIRIPMT